MMIGRLALSCISWPWLSRVYGRITRLQRPRFFPRWLIRSFQKHYKISMDEFQGQADAYRSLSEFFLRPFDPEKRRLETNDRCLLSPADGRLSELELVDGDLATQVKGWSYPLSLLLAENLDFSKKWYLATIYLSPRDYHRFHYPVSARITGSFHGGIRRFPVNDFSVKRVKRLYIRNERIVTRFVFQNRPLYLVAIGATFVGNIGMKHLPAGLPAYGKWHELDVPVEQMAEMGHFAMGSTIILVVAAACVEAVLARKGEAVRVGQPLFEIRN